ncbi:bacterial transcriptional activator domain-containing protein [Frankia sp. QA3]|uniref:AfsR/SARP family transcriptional regulator n=1 Tax=Frankia sp. QA3 TaxID=710111 RepID=UPI0018DED31D|nr:bacterial transcriptional activator domain-containing protein [Frankia sp. QA3]
MTPGPTSTRRSTGTAPTRLFLLDGFRLVHDGESAGVPRGLQRLIAVIGLHPGCSRSYLTGLLWPDIPEERALSRFRTGLWRLRKYPCRIMIADGDSVRLDPGIVVDVDDLVRVATDVRADGDLRLAFKVLTAGRDDLLPGWYDDWVLLDRERLRQLRLHALERIAHAHVRAGEFGEALQASIEALRTEPLRETPHRLLVQIHLAEGNTFEALQAFYSYRELMRRDLHLEPSTAMYDLVEPILKPLRDGGRSRRTVGTSTTVRSGSV